MTRTQAESLSTDVYHDGNEVAVRARSQNSRSAHTPATDDDGTVLFYDDDGDVVDESHDDAQPRPECTTVRNLEDTEWVLRTIRQVNNRDKCKRCANGTETSGGGVTFARRMRYGDDWGKGSEETSANKPQTSGD